MNAAAKPATVRDVMSTNVVSISPDLTLRDTLGVFVDRHITGAPVLAGGRVVGVMSATDLLSFEASNAPSGNDQLELGDLETEEWKEGAEPPGAFYSESWNGRSDVAERFDESPSTNGDLLVEHTVAEVMTRKVWWVRPDMVLREAASRMVKRGIHRLLVLDHGRLVGILTTMDVVRAVAEGRI